MCGEVVKLHVVWISVMPCSAVCAVRLGSALLCPAMRPPSLLLHWPSPLTPAPPLPEPPLPCCSGMAYMHDHWVLHRDLKTSNILYTNRCGCWVLGRGCLVWGRAEGCWER